MRMGEKYIVDIARLDGEGCIFVDVDPLLHAAVDKDHLARGLDDMTASRHFMVSAYK